MPNGNQTNNNTCKAHSGIVERLNDVEGRTTAQGKKIESIINRSTATLTAVVFILVGVVINLIISWPK